MDKLSINFEAWCRNHEEDHIAKWCRELYPWEVFQRIEYEEELLGNEQMITAGDSTFKAIVQSRYNGSNGRINYKIHLTYIPETRLSAWLQRSWDDLFHLVCEPNGMFITLYTEKKDPSQLLVRRFFNSQFTEVHAQRSLPVSGLLFRSIISEVAHRYLPNIERYKSFSVLKPFDIERLGSYHLQGNTYEPFLSNGRDTWISFSFTEEKAHRLALRLRGQAGRIIVVYCHPTFSKHHRISEEGISVVSLTQFLRLFGPEALRRYIDPARFLINHICLSSDIFSREHRLDSKTAMEQLYSQTNPVEIKTADLREAKAGLCIMVKTAADAAYVCACANLLNAAMNRSLNVYRGSVVLTKNVYSFKEVLGRAIEEIILSRPDGVKVFVGTDDLIYIKVCGLQFSFHAIPRTGTISHFQRSNDNIPQKWDEKRLQPVAPLVLRWARCLVHEQQ